MWSLAVLSFVSTYIAIVLIGSHECFQGTIIERWHYALTDGVCAALEAALDKACGQRGVAVLEATEAACCRGSNPIGQIFFLTLFSACYLGIHATVFPLIDLNRDEVSVVHRYTGAATAVLVLFLFIIVSWSDPGKITNDPSLLDANMALYPPDGTLFPHHLRVCAACGTTKPPRSKHCNATKACVARFDHWCIWVNNALGLLNLRWFILFLISVTFACFYGAVVTWRAISADMRRIGAWNTQWRDLIDPNKSIYLHEKWGLIVQYVLSRYGVASSSGIFLGVCSWIALGFTAMQLYRIAIGVTTNESWKAKELRRNGISVDLGFYNRGWRRNFAEIVFPHYYLLQTNKKQ